MLFDYTTLSMPTPTQAELQDDKNPSSDAPPTNSGKPVVEGLAALGNNLKFPSDLGSVGNSHSVTFFISVVENNQNKKSYGNRISSDSPLYQRDGSTSVSKTISKLSSGKAITSYKRLKNTIRLPFPDNIVTNYTLNWDQDAAGLALELGAAIDGIAGSEKKTKDAIKIATTYAIHGAGSMLNFVGADSLANAVQLGTKQVKNPRIEVLFRGVNNRTFDMSWDFFPSNEQEAADIRMILQSFKHHAHPELVDGTAGSFFLYPSVFDIELRTGDVQNPWLFQTSTCALTNISINMTPTGTWNAVEGSNNQHFPAPVGYSLTLSFMEMEVLTKNNIQEAWAESSSKAGSNTELRF